VVVEPRQRSGLVGPANDILIDMLINMPIGLLISLLVDPLCDLRIGMSRARKVAESIASLGLWNLPALRRRRRPPAAPWKTDCGPHGLPQGSTGTVRTFTEETIRGLWHESMQRRATRNGWRRCRWSW
jgi:hypothetical protein